jgi:mannitol-1-phosphate 5-dehydrogenase
MKAENAMAEKIVVFGAGATGRGHVGLLTWQAGFEIIFVDKKPSLVEKLKNPGHYVVKLYGEKKQEIIVGGYRVHHSANRMAIAEEIRDAALVLTAVFDQNLADVALTVAGGITACICAGRAAPLNVIACENMMDSSSQLGRHVLSHLTAEEKAWCERYVGFPDCMISRVVPRPEPDPLVVVAEDYNEWTARAESFRGAKPSVLVALELVDNQTARLERKLFIHNGGHAACGYFGYHAGHQYIHEAVADPWVAKKVLGVLDELGAVVERKWGFSTESIAAYKRDLGRRGAVPEMRDEILRVVRDPIRKLSTRERLVAPAKLAVDYGLPRKWIVKAMVAALRYRHPQDPQSLVLAERLSREGLAPVLQNICEIEPHSALADEIQSAWNDAAE